MRLLEFEGKQIFERYGIPIQTGIIVISPEEAVAAAEKIGYPVVLKAQVLAGGRGKAGGVRFAHNASEVIENSRNILGIVIKEEVTKCLLVNGIIDIGRELYAGITIDPGVGLPVLMFSTSGGMDIELIAKGNPKIILRMHLDPTKIYRPYDMVNFLQNSDLNVSLLPKVANILLRLIQCFYGADATTTEINPLIITKDQQVIALDSKVVIDDSALKRQPLFIKKEEQLSPIEERAKKVKVNYVTLDGYIAVIAGGAGLAMATMDLVSHFGGKPASFLDTGGGISSDRMAEALRISLETKGVKGVIINVFGGINDCEMIAKGIAEVIDRDQPTVPIVVKMRGHAQDEGWKILEDRNIPIIKFGTSEEAIRLLLNTVGRNG